MTRTEEIKYALACNTGEARIIEATIDAYGLQNAEMKATIRQALDIARGN